jgi:small subunit ribosomal protein S11
MKKLKIQNGIIHALCTFNNTLITLTTTSGQVVKQLSSGCLGFKGAKRSTSFAAKKVIEEISNKCKELGFYKLEVQLNGIGAGRQRIPKILKNKGLTVIKIKDVTPFPFNGCRLKKKRRV